MGLAGRREGRGRALRHRKTGRFHRRKASEFHSANRRSPLAERKLFHSRNDGLERWARGSTYLALPRRAGLVSRLKKKRCPARGAARSRRRSTTGEDYELLFAIAPNDASSLQAKWRRKFSSSRTHSYRRLASGRRLRASAFLPWLRSFQIAGPKRLLSRVTG